MSYTYTTPQVPCFSSKGLLAYRKQKSGELSGVDITRSIVIVWILAQLATIIVESANITKLGLEHHLRYLQKQSNSDSGSLVST